MSMTMMVLDCGAISTVATSSTRTISSRTISDIGIFHEISFNAVIRNNVVRHNGSGNRGWFWGADIVVAASAGRGGDRQYGYRRPGEMRDHADRPRAPRQRQDIQDAQQHRSRQRDDIRGRRLRRRRLRHQARVTRILRSLPTAITGSTATHIVFGRGERTGPLRVGPGRHRLERLPAEGPGAERPPGPVREMIVKGRGDGSIMRVLKGGDLIMQYRSFGGGGRVSVLGMGCGRVGSINNMVPMREIEATLEAAVEAGVTFSIPLTSTVKATASVPSGL